MNKLTSILTALLLAPLAALHAAEASLRWPAVTRECKPWAYNW